MSITLVIAKRELSSFFFSPIAYVVMALFMLIAGLFFMTMTFIPSFPATLQATFVGIVWLMILIAPAISMRLLAEEFRSGTLEPLMTSPVTDIQVILGKWLGAMSFYAIVLATTLLFVLMLAIWGKPDYGSIFAGYLGLLLIGGLYLAIGTFASSLTRNQIIAFLITVFLVLMISFVPFIIPRVIPAQYADYVTAIAYINVNQQFEDFARGVIEIQKIVYFLSGIVLFLAFAVKTLESRRWR